MRYGGSRSAVRQPVKVLELGFRRGGEGRRYTGYKLGSRVLRVDPAQNFGVRTMTFHRGRQCGFPSVRMRKEDVPNARQ